MKQRVQTGKMQSEDDWPGVFIRGDDALGFAAIIRQLLAVEAFRDLLLHSPAIRDCRHHLHELAALLESCRAKRSQRAPGRS